MLIGKGPPSTLSRNARRALIIRRHRRMLEEEVRAFKLGELPDEDVPRVFEFDEGSGR